MPDRRTLREYGVLGFLVLLTAALYARYSLFRHDQYRSAGFDLGIYDQAIWHWSRFETAVSTIRRVPNLFGDHFHPALMLYAPVEWLGDGTRNLLVVQAIVVTAAAFPIYRFARRRLDVVPSGLLTGAYLVSWGVAVGLALDVHDTSWSALALAFTLEAYDRRAKGALAVSVLFLLLTREDQSLTVLVLGLLALGSRRPREGAALVGIGIGWLVLTVGYLIPSFNGAPFEHWEYRALATSPRGLVVLALTRPGIVAKALLVPRVKLDTMLRCLGAFGLLPLLSPYVLLMIPTLGATLLSDIPSRWEPFYHYWMTVAVIGAIAAADGLGRLSPRFEVWSRRPVLASRATLGLAVFALLCGAWLSRFVPQREMLRAVSARDAQIARDGDRLLATLPPEASVSATNNALGHLGHRRDAYLLRYGGFDAPGFPPIRAEYVVVDPRAVAQARHRRGHPFEDPDYRLVAKEGDWSLFRLRPGLTPAHGFQPQSAGDRAGPPPIDLRTVEPVR